MKARRQRIEEALWTLQQASTIASQTGLSLALVADLDTVIGAGLRDGGFIREAALRLRDRLTPTVED